MRVDFRHLTRTPVERALSRVAERVVAEGGRLLVVSAEKEQRRTIDRALWTYAPESFLPHGEAGAGDDAMQAVLLSEKVVAANGARTIALVDGAWRDEATGFDRAFHFFTDEHLEAARAAWRGLAGRDDVERSYWRQGDDGWEQVA